MKNIIRFLRKKMVTFAPILSNKIMYHYLTGRRLNLKKPLSFNDKINWLKLYDYPNSDLVVKCSDKFRVREFLKENDCEKYLVNLIDSWDNVSEIDWARLPRKFVLKCNHGSKYNIVCANKEELYFNEVKKKLNYWMHEDFGKTSCEPHYSKIKRRIICEEYLGDDLIDLQVWCVRGEILFVVYINSPHGVNAKKTFDKDWNELSFVTSPPKIKEKISKPKKLDEMISISQKLSKNFKFLRMDFYILKNGDVKISEMSFSPASGFVNWQPVSIDYEIGKKIKLK